MFSGSASAVSSGSRPWSLIAKSPVGSAGGGHTSHCEKFGPPSFLAPCVGATALGHSLVNFHVEAGKRILSFCQTSPHCAARHVTATCVAFRYGSVVVRSPVTSEAQ